ncbi:MAG: sulfotransferase [Brevundimonas sp.]|uniref:sulfotransferase family protein n=1 Tax=Brevundimonas sp. TaxID=1871086 RepID=UPI002590C471|nr:sulfotransferase [Brevundimonas sp.]MCV0413390.1 sulfotransferase [Brevundimonas sp.]
MGQLSDTGPVAVGALGGSGTRMIAQLLRQAGYDLGSDLNMPNDNLWAALLMNRRDLAVATEPQFARVAGFLFDRIQGRRPSPEAVDLAWALAARPHLQYSEPWLMERARTFVEGPFTDAPPLLWGWKLPPTHVFADRFLTLRPDLRYIHVVRNGLDMAFSRNQNQRAYWGPVFLAREIQPTPRDALAYWCAVQRRMEALKSQFPDRILAVDFDRFCREPRQVCAEILTFCGRPADTQVIETVAGEVRTPDSMGGYRRQDLSDLDPRDVAYVAAQGYPID